MGGDFLSQAVIYLSAAVISVPLSKRLGLGSVLGYLIAGILVGPFALGLVGEEREQVMHFAEFGVVMMLFLIGLELQPSLLVENAWADYWHRRGASCNHIYSPGRHCLLVWTTVAGGRRHRHDARPFFNGYYVADA